MAAVVIAWLAQEAHAETLITCGASDGYGYYPAGGPVSEADAGWREDPISVGSISLVTLEDGSPDIVFSDATGKSFSSRGDGAKVVVTYETPETIQVVSIYTETGVVETHIFMIGVNQDMWTVSKAGTPIQKVAAYTASCS